MCKGKVRLLLYLILLCFFLTGCVPDEFTKEEAVEQERKAMEIFTRYLDDELEGGEIENVSVCKETPPHTMGYYLTDFVDGTFTYGGKSYSFVVNTRTEEIYTSLEVKELEEKGMKYVLDSFDIACDEIVESRFMAGLNVPALREDKENLFEGRLITLDGVLPVDFEASKEEIEALFEDESCEIKLYITYKGSAGLNQEGYGIEKLPGLKLLELKHMKSKAEASEELGGIYDYMMSETLEETVQNESRSVRYARWKHLEHDGFHMFFENYCREDLDGEVKETALEADEDIYFLVEGERIEIFCTGETNFFFFAENFSEKESEMPVVWEFVRESGRMGHAEITWLRDKNRYVLGSLGERKPSAFSVEAGNYTFYLGDAAKKVLED